MTARPGGGGGRRVPDPAACQRVAEQMLALALKAGADGAEVLVGKNVVSSISRGSSLRITSR